METLSYGIFLISFYPKIKFLQKNLDFIIITRKNIGSRPPRILKFNSFNNEIYILKDTQLLPTRLHLDNGRVTGNFFHVKICLSTFLMPTDLVKTLPRDNRRTHENEICCKPNRILHA